MSEPMMQKGTARSQRYQAAHKVASCMIASFLDGATLRNHRTADSTTEYKIDFAHNLQQLNQHPVSAAA
jgi:hypothetical protein